MTLGSLTGKVRSVRVSMPNHLFTYFGDFSD